MRLQLCAFSDEPSKLSSKTSSQFLSETQGVAAMTEDPESERKRIGKRSVVLMNIIRKYRGGAAWCQ